MAFDTLTKAIRLLVGRRYTSTDLTDSQEAFASTIQIGSSEIWSQTNLIPSASLPYSSSATAGTTVTSGVIKYWYKWPLTVANNTVTGSSVWYFTSPTGSVDGIGSQLIDVGQQTNFISPKYISDSNIVFEDEDGNIQIFDIDGFLSEINDLDSSDYYEGINVLEGDIEDELEKILGVKVDLEYLPERRE